MGDMQKSDRVKLGVLIDSGLLKRLRHEKVESGDDISDIVAEALVPALDARERSRAGRPLVVA